MPNMKSVVQKELEKIEFYKLVLNFGHNTYTCSIITIIISNYNNNNCCLLLLSLIVVYCCCLLLLSIVVVSYCCLLLLSIVDYVNLSFSLIIVVIISFTNVQHHFIIHNHTLPYYIPSLTR